MTHLSTSSWGELIWHPCSGTVLVSEPESVRKLLSWLTYSCILTFSNVLWSLQLRPQLSNVFLIYFFSGTWLPANDNADFSMVCVVCSGISWGGFTHGLLLVLCVGSRIYLFVVLFCLRTLPHCTTLHKTLSFHVCGWSPPTSLGIHTVVPFGMTVQGFLKTIFNHEHSPC